MSYWYQTQISLKAQSRGAHIVTYEVLKHLPELSDVKVGNLHLFLQHTSASLTINENADPTVRSDLKAFMDHCVPENQDYFLHTLEGADDMPAHIKSALLGFDLNIPISQGKLMLGTWQGIYLMEHRNHAGKRKIVATISGQGS
jgi:secondary thiamine-phosphate synthase enzyme